MTAGTGSHLCASDITVELGGQVVLDDVSIDVSAGEFVALVGPNGAGKSTLLSVLAGDRTPQRGSVTLDDRPISSLSTADLARRRAVLPQENRLAFGFRVVDVVRMGRTAWAKRPEEALDEQTVTEAMRRTDTLRLADRVFPTLSGGERARSSLARVLAQSTALVLLDEPTAALDVRHVEIVMCQARSLARDGHAVVAVLHDLSIAAEHADRVCVLSQGKMRAVGPPRDVMTSALLTEVYEHHIDVVEHRGRLMILPASLPVGSIDGSPLRSEESCVPS